MNIGCDIVKNDRLKNKNKRFIALLLTKNEQEEYQKKGFSYLCGRFCAKEAVMKALPNTKSLSFLDIEILNDLDGKPICTTHKYINISISHEKEYTIAFALNTKNDQN